MSWLGELLAKGTVVGDGAMGSMLMRSGLAPGACAELWNVDRPDVVASIHRQYVHSGAMWLTTNSFGGSPLSLARHGLEARAAELNRAAVLNARLATGGLVRVLGDVGPFGGFLEPYGETTPAAAEQAFRVQIEALRDGGAHGIIVETMVDPAELAIAVRVARSAGAWPVLATYAFQIAGDSFRTLMGTTVAEAMGAAVAAGADAVGANCGTGLELSDYLRLARELVAASEGKPVILQPNAGKPDESGNYSAQPEDFRKWTIEAQRIGVQIIGGCCGTSPHHIKAIAGSLHVAA